MTSREIPYRGLKIERESERHLFVIKQFANNLKIKKIHFQTVLDPINLITFEFQIGSSNLVFSLKSPHRYYYCITRSDACPSRISGAAGGSIFRNVTQIHIGEAAAMVNTCPVM